MKKVVVFAGTTEGRELVEALEKSNIPCHVCVATEYGSMLLKESSLVTVHEGRLDKEGMEKLYSETACDIVVDATHPYATLVTETIKESLENKHVKYIRLLRDNDVKALGDNVYFYQSAEECARALEKCPGRVLLTTGSKQLKDFCEDEALRERLYVRVLPGLESVKLCYEAGLEGRQIIAMQGPFSLKMNQATIEEYDIKHLVTKESGATGGVDSKLAAALASGIRVHVIKRPDEGCKDISSQAGLTEKEAVKALEDELGVSLKRGRVEVSLAGIGPGNQSMMTGEVEEAIAHADYVFGAPRMLDSISCKGTKYPYYLKKDIIPALMELQQENIRDISAIVLFSGDSGFYSGSKKMHDALSECSDWSVRVLAGVSSVSALSAKLGIDWQDGKILSLHGVEEKDWIPDFTDSVKYNEKTFFITSGVRDINKIGEILEKQGSDLMIYLGYQLSYPNEKILTLNAKECESLDAEGLYVGLIVNRGKDSRPLLPQLSDDDFIRDAVPMTKEEIRKLSICQMKIRDRNVIYDIGSGTGSIAVQIGLLSPKLRVYAIECKTEAVELINKNIEKYNLSNVKTIEAMAPEGLENLPKADVSFIGGSKGNLNEILHTLRKINPSMRVVMNAVSMESICEMNKLLSEYEVKDLLIEQISVSRANKLGGYHLMTANNPVFIFSFQFC